MLTALLPQLCTIAALPPDLCLLALPFAFLAIGMIASARATEKLVYTRREAAEALQISESTLDKLIAAGEIATCRFGPRGVRISRRALDAAIEKQEKAAAE